MTAELTLRILPLPALLFLLALGAALTAFLYRRDRALVPPGVGRTLLGLRIALVALVSILLADPALVNRQEVIEPGEVLLVLDASRSFSLSDPHKPAWQKVREARALGYLPPQGERESARTSEDETARRAEDAQAAEAEPARLAMEEVGRKSRWELVARALETGWLEDLASRFRISAHALDKASRPIAMLSPLEGHRAAARAFLKALPEPDGPTTDLARPLVEEVARRSDAPPAAVVIFTDGNHHEAGDPRLEARSLGSMGVPIVAVGAGALEKPPDLAIESIDATGVIFNEDDVKAQVTISTSGLPARELPVTISESGDTVKEFLAELPAGEGTVKLPVDFSAGAPGRKKFTFSFPPQEGETTAENNARDLWVDVQSEKAKVLLLDDRPRWEMRYLRDAWSRDKNVELQHFLVTPPPERRLPQGFPRSRDELFEHDVVVIGDVEPSVFAREEIEYLRDHVSARGGALIIICGDRAMPYKWGQTALTEVLPVHLIHPAPPPGLGAALGREGLPLTLTPSGQASQITRLIPGRERNLELWELLPGPVWLSPIAAVKPGADVLVTVSPAAAPRLSAGLGLPASAAKEGETATRLAAEKGAILAVEPHGAGRVIYLGMDSTWKWRDRFGDELHIQFWGQVVRWAIASRLSASDDRVRLGSDKLIYENPARVILDAIVRREGGKPYEGEWVDAVITRATDGARARARMALIPRSGGRYRAAADLEQLGLSPPPPSAAAPQAASPGGSRSLATVPGGRNGDDGASPSRTAPQATPVPGGSRSLATATEYKVELEIPEIDGYSSGANRASLTFVVEPRRDLEALDVACNVKLLEDMASASGGQFLPLYRFREALRLIPEKQRIKEQVTRRSPWDHPLAVAIAVLGLIALEWIIRKQRDLV